MTTTAPGQRAQSGAPLAPPTPTMLNHLAYVTPSAEDTVDFYTRVMKMDFVQAVMDDRIPSTGDPFPYFHIFFRMRDGSTLAFFEAPDLPPRSKPSHPAYETFDHLALHADSVADVDAWHAHISAQGIEVVGPVNHGIIYSIYFYDPVNDIRLEITTPLDPDWNNRGEAAHEALETWAAAKQRAREKGTSVLEEIQIQHRATTALESDS